MDLTDKINELALLMQGHRADTEQAGHELNEKQQQLEKKLTELSASLEHLVDTLRAVFGKSTAPSKPLSRKNTKEK